jgi:hypothetical protein
MPGLETPFITSHITTVCMAHYLQMPRREMFRGFSRLAINCWHLTSSPEKRWGVGATAAEDKPASINRYRGAFNKERSVSMGMPISSIASGNATQQLQGAGLWQVRQQSFNALSNALQSGDINAARQAFSSLSSSYPAGVVNDPNSAIGKLGLALQSGDLSAAQSALSAMRGHHHHPGGGASTNIPIATSGSAGGTVGSNFHVTA